MVRASVRVVRMRGMGGRLLFDGMAVWWKSGQKAPTSFRRRADLTCRHRGSFGTQRKKSFFDVRQSGELVSGMAMLDV